MKKASMNGASGSGCVAVGPPAMTSGSSSPRSAARSGMPRQVQRRSSTLVYVSSYCSEKPTTSNSASGAADSSVSSGRPRARSSASSPARARTRARRRCRRLLVEHAVQDLRPQVGHPDLVDVGERQADARRDARRPACAPPGTRRRRSATASRPCRETPRMGAACRPRSSRRPRATRSPGRRAGTRCRTLPTPAGTPSAARPP